LGEREARVSAFAHASEAGLQRGKPIT